MKNGRLNQRDLFRATGNFAKCFAIQIKGRRISARAAINFRDRLLRNLTGSHKSLKFYFLRHLESDCKRTHGQVDRAIG